MIQLRRLAFWHRTDEAAKNRGALPCPRSCVATWVRCITVAADDLCNAMAHSLKVLLLHRNVPWWTFFCFFLRIHEDPALASEQRKVGPWMTQDTSEKDFDGRIQTGDWTLH